MLAAYLITAIVGGVLVGVSILAGGDGDAGGHGGDLHSDVDGDGHGGDGADHAGPVDALLSWLPIGSLRFWTFFAAFFGLTGTAMTVLAAAGPIPIAVAAIAVGYTSGLVLTRAIRHLHTRSSDSSLAEADLIGSTALVLLPVGSGRTGKVRVHIKDRTVDLLAETQEEAELVTGENVLVIAVPREGHAMVARLDRQS
ncbi:MAG TPA: hypothetical protein VNO33_19000 [Kofleriaceae bacterium]|nr:hypothetical protein [Kofleriaceae bacterium]